MHQTPPRRLIVVKPNRRPPLAPIPTAVFKEPVYVDEQPYDGPDDDSDGDWDDAA